MTALRGALWLAGFAALLASPVDGGSANAESGPYISPFIAPAAPMVLTRVLRRPLADGQEVVSVRSYLLQFLPEAGRIRVDGSLLAVTVEAPPTLAPLAEMERRRSDDGIFPMWLDANGMLLPGAATRLPEPGRQQAVDRTANWLGGFPLSPAEEVQAMASVTTLGSSAAGRTPWPEDLFRPTAKSRREVRALSFAHGEGEVTVESETTVADGLLVSYARSTVTEFAGERRVVTEEWLLTKAP